MKNKKKAIKEVANTVEANAASTPGAFAIAALVGIGAFLIRRKLTHTKAITAAMEAATLAASAFGAVRKATATK